MIHPLVWNDCWIKFQNMEDANIEQWKNWGRFICGITESTRLTQRIYTWKGLPVSCLNRQNQQNLDYLSLDFLTCVCVQSCPTLWDPHELCSLPGSSAHGISWARILEWVAISYSRGSSWSRDWTCVSCIGRWVLYHCASWEANFPSRYYQISLLPFSVKCLKD